MLRLGTTLLPEDTGERGREFRTHRAEGVEPGTEIDRVDRDQGLSHLAANGFPPGTGGVVTGKGTRCREQAHVARLGGVESGPELRRQRLSVWLQGLTDDRRYFRAYGQHPIEKWFDLSGIHRQEGKAGVKFVGRPLLCLPECFFQCGIDPAPVVFHRVHNARNLGGVGLEYLFHEPGGFGSPARLSDPLTDV